MIYGKKMRHACSSMPSFVRSMPLPLRKRMRLFMHVSGVDHKFFG
jgi:hypothetical protein